MTVLKLVLAALLVCAGCAREIGDECSLNSDCGTARICDTSQPGGYCTISPCRSGDCPSEATCVDFSTEVSYCLRWCDDLNPCRTGYHCVQCPGLKGFCDQSGPTGGTCPPTVKKAS